MFAALLEPHMPAMELTWIDLYRGETPPPAGAYDAYICTGSRCSVYDDRPWIAALKDFVREVQECGKPFVGICFGHQMLAEALGGKVEKAAQGWGVGVHDMYIVRPENWMTPQLSHCKLQYMHADQVQHLPRDSTLLASAEHCRVAMFRIGPRMLGIEGHPEFPAAYVEALLRDRLDRIGPDRVEAGIASLRERTDHETAGRWISNFLEAAHPSS